MTSVWVDLGARALVVGGLLWLVYIVASIVWHKLAAIQPFAVECVEHGEFDDDDCPGCLPEDGVADRDHDHFVDRELGVSL